MSLTTQVLIRQFENDPTQAPRVTADHGLAALVYHVSALAHSDAQIDELVERTGSLVLYSLHADSIQITLRGARTDSLATFSDSRARSSAEFESFLFSRPVTIRGVHYGHLQIGISHAGITTAKWPLKALLPVAETIVELLGRRAEREELRVEVSALRERVEDLRNRRQLDVLLTRAGGIVARERDWEQAKAREWIRQEALRLGHPLLRFAERLILAQTLSRRLTHAHPGMPIGRTA
jgi:hypothetical protein